MKIADKIPHAGDVEHPSEGWQERHTNDDNRTARNETLQTVSTALLLPNELGHPTYMEKMQLKAA